MRRRSFLSELFSFVISHKTYLLIPIIVVLLLVGVLIILGGTKAAPFIREVSIRSPSGISISFTGPASFLIR